MKEVNLKNEDVHQTLDTVMKQVLDLGQSSLSENQFRAFRKLVMDYFAEGKRQINKGRYGTCKSMAKGVVNMNEI